MSDAPPLLKLDLTTLSKAQRRLPVALENIERELPTVPSAQGGGGSEGTTSDRTGNRAAVYQDVGPDAALHARDRLRGLAGSIERSKFEHAWILGELLEGRRRKLGEGWARDLRRMILDFDGLVNVWARTPAIDKRLRGLGQDRPGCVGCAQVEEIRGGVVTTRHEEIIDVDRKLCAKCSRLLDRVNGMYEAALKVPLKRLVEIQIERRVRNNDIYAAMGRLPKAANR